MTLVIRKQELGIRKPLVTSYYFLISAGRRGA